ncbi:MAG: glycine zipper 2TM domain-containing protein [Sulfurimonadaceae bacterium]
MKTLLLAVALLLGTSAMANSSHNYYQNDHNRYSEVQPTQKINKKSKHHFVKVLHSRPIYEEVVTYRECRPNHNKHQIDGHKGAIIGGVVGGIIGSRVASKHKLPHTIGGAVTGAIIGATLNRHRQRPAPYCEHVEQRLVGYENIAYWGGRKIVRISERPLQRIRIDRKNGRHPNDLRYAKRY